LFISKGGQHFGLDLIGFLNLDRWCFSALMPSENTVEGCHLFHDGLGALWSAQLEFKQAKGGKRDDAGEEVAVYFAVGCRLSQ